jgi:long-chain acyl-CoA synthetase
LRRSAKHTERSFAEASRGGKIETMAQQFRSVPDIVLRSFDRAPRTDCLVWKADGDWREASSAQVQECILEVAAGLRRLGVAAGDRVGILVPSSVWWLQFDLGALFLGAVTVPLFDNLSEEHFRFETSDAGIGLIFVADAAQRALVRRVGPEGIRIVTLEPGDPDGCTSLESLRAGHAREDLDRIRREAEGVAAADLATLIYTSGSTGSPKGVEITHGALAFQVGAVFERYPLDPARDVCLTCLPLAHVFERMVVLYHLAAGVRLVFAENVQAVGEAMRQQRPTVVTVVPRLLEKILEKIELGAREAPLVRRTLVGLAIAEGAKPLSVLRFPWRKLMAALVYRKIRALMGGRLRLVVAGGAALGQRTERLFQAIGVPVYQGYGLTEHGPVVSANFPGAKRAGSVGKAFPGVEIRLESDGEVLVRSPSVLRGYWKRPEETSAVKDVDGWLHTGDLGRLDDDGFLFLTGRKKDLCKSANGKYVAPVPIEEMLAAHKGLEHAVLCVDGRKFVSALLSADTVALRRRMLEKDFQGTLEEFRDGPFRASVQRHVDRVNAKLDSWARVRKWAFVEQFTVATGELTPTLKVRRNEVLRRNAPILEDLYRE